MCGDELFLPWSRSSANFHSIHSIKREILCNPIEGTLKYFLNNPIKASNKKKQSFFHKKSLNVGFAIKKKNSVGILTFLFIKQLTDLNIHFIYVTDAAYFAQVFL